MRPIGILVLFCNLSASVLLPSGAYSQFKPYSRALPPECPEPSIVISEDVTNDSIKLGASQIISELHTSGASEYPLACSSDGREMLYITRTSEGYSYLSYANRKDWNAKWDKASFDEWAENSFNSDALDSLYLQRISSAAFSKENNALYTLIQNEKGESRLRKYERVNASSPYLCTKSILINCLIGDFVGAMSITSNDQDIYLFIQNSSNCRSYMRLKLIGGAYVSQGKIKPQEGASITPGSFSEDLGLFACGIQASDRHHLVFSKASFLGDTLRHLFYPRFNSPDTLWVNPQLITLSGNIAIIGRLVKGVSQDAPMFEARVSTLFPSAYRRGAEVSNGIIVFPNPAQHEVCFRSTSGGKGKLIIFRSNGSVYASYRYDFSSDYCINASMDNGVYQGVFRSDKGESATVRFSIQK